MFSKILVGFDGSDPSERALRAACAIAQKFDAALEVCHTPKDETVIFAAEAISGFYVGPNIAKTEALAEAAKKMGERAQAIASECGVSPLEIHIGHTNPAEDILARAKADQVDLIVTGRRGLGDLRGLLLGSVSSDVSAGADCACLTVA